MRFIRHPSEDTPRGHAKDAIERMVLSRGYKVGDKLPPYRELASHLGIAVCTVVRVMRQMADEGVVQLLHGKGVFVKKLPAGSGQLAQVGLVYPASRWHLVRTSYLNQILSGMILLCEQQHIDLHIVSLRTAAGPIPPQTLAIRVDAMILLEVINERYIAEFAREPIPIVLVDAQTHAAPIHSVCVDNPSAVGQVMNHLYTLGHRRIAYLDVRSHDALAQGTEPAWLDTADTQERRLAYEDARQQLGLSYHRTYLLVEDDMPQVAASLLADVKHKSHAPSAVLCYDDVMASDLCGRMAASGLRVPKDLSVAAAVGSRGGNTAGSHVITCAIQDFDLMGRRTIQALQRQTTGPSHLVPPVERVPNQLEIGTSTASPPRR